MLAAAAVLAILLAIVAAKMPNRDAWCKEHCGVGENIDRPRCCCSKGMCHPGSTPACCRDETAVLLMVLMGTTGLALLFCVSIFSDDIRRVYGLVHSWLSPLFTRDEQRRLAV